MFKNIKAFFKKHSEEIFTALTALFFCITIITSIWAYTMTVLVEDLNGVVSMKDTEIQELKRSNFMLHAKADDIEQTYENSVPKFEYDNKIQYYESVISELTTQCEKECKKCGN